MTICDDDMAAKLSQATFADSSAEYAAFEKKFLRHVKNTDDCYTPRAVYDVVLVWVLRRYQIVRDAQIVRPFYPGGDYEAFDYPPGCVVIDNPPFSRLRAIVRFYSIRGIKFFLFCPALTAFRECSRDLHTGVVIASGAHIIYDNGAFVRTAFCTNLSSNILEVSPELGEMIKSVVRRKASRSVVRRSVQWPDGAICSVAAICAIRSPLSVKFSEAAPIERLDNYGKLFGGGLLLAPSAVERVKAFREESKKYEHVELSSREIAMQQKIEEDWRKNYAENQDDEKSDRACVEDGRRGGDKLHD